MKQRRLVVSIGVAALLAPAALPVQAQTPQAETADHLQCYDIKDDLKLRAIADLSSQEFGLDPNCTIGKGKLYCVPATKTVRDVPTLPHMTGSDPGARICYDVKCKTPSIGLPGMLAADQFGVRSLTIGKTRLLCTPAVKVLPGFLGRTEIETPIFGHEGDQYWVDSDGVDPAIPGCHFPFTGRSVAGACTGSLAPAGVFGEFCNPAEDDPSHQPGFPVGALIESNPAAGVCHPHKNGQGHPDVYDCDAFCKGMLTEHHTGACVADLCVADETIASARCECTEP